MDLAVHADVLAVCVAECARVKERVVERRVEAPCVCRLATADGHATEHLVPSSARGAADGAKRTSTYLSLEVGARILDAYVGDPDPNLYRALPTPEGDEGAR